jgi:cold shock CspA family protein
MVEEDTGIVEDVKVRDVRQDMTPWVSYYNPKRGYGFLQDPSSQKNLFFHISDVENIQTVGRIELFDKIESFGMGRSDRDDRPKAINVVFKKRDEVKSEEEGETDG